MRCSAPQPSRAWPLAPSSTSPLRATPPRSILWERARNVTPTAPPRKQHSPQIQRQRSCPVPPQSSPLRLRSPLQAARSCPPLSRPPPGSLEHLDEPVRQPTVQPPVGAPPPPPPPPPPSQQVALTPSVALSQAFSVTRERARNELEKSGNDMGTAARHLMQPASGGAPPPPPSPPPPPQVVLQTDPSVDQYDIAQWLERVKPGYRARFSRTLATAGYGESPVSAER